MNDHVLAFMKMASALKLTPRVGWNINCHLGRRHVPNAESAGGHTFGVGALVLAMYATLGHRRFAVHYNLGKVFLLITVHDLIEGDPEVGDVSIYLLPPGERAAAKAAKDARERTALERHCAKLGELGALWRELAAEYEAGETPEARLVKELDKLEVCIQAFIYWLDDVNNHLDPTSFFENARPILTIPWITEQLDALVARHAEEVEARRPEPREREAATG